MDENNAADVSSTAVKIPPFWATDPVLWFAQIESQFATSRISNDKTKFHHVIASLDPSVAAEIREIIISPPNENLYDTLKKELISRTSLSEQQRLRELLSAEELGDRTPTQLLRRMQQLLAGKNMDPSILAQLFLQRLPSDVRKVLAASATLPLETQASIADKVLEVSVPACLPVNMPANHPQFNLVEISELKDMVKNLSCKVEELSRKVYTRGRSRSNTRNRYTSSSKKQDHSTNGLCWYHEKYGAKAHHCKSPCNFQGNENSQET